MVVAVDIRKSLTNVLTSMNAILIPLPKCELQQYRCINTLLNVAVHTIDGSKCYDINECSTGNRYCDVNKAKCVKLIDSFSCKCKSGYIGSGRDHRDVNECDEDPCGTNQNCINHTGSYQCVWKPGYEVESCSNINE